MTSNNQQGSTNIWDVLKSGVKLQNTIIASNDSENDVKNVQLPVLSDNGGPGNLIIADDKSENKVESFTVGGQPVRQVATDAQTEPVRQAEPLGEDVTDGVTRACDSTSTNDSPSMGIKIDVQPQLWYSAKESGDLLVQVGDQRFYGLKAMVTSYSSTLKDLIERHKPCNHLIVRGIQPEVFEEMWTRWHNAEHQLKFEAYADELKTAAIKFGDTKLQQDCENYM